MASPSRPRPLRIGLSARLLHRVPAELGFRGKTLQYIEQTVAHWIMQRRALAFMLPTLATGAGIKRERLAVADCVRELDALVLQGGADLSPLSYGEEPLSPEWAGDRVRDAYEIELLWEFIIQGKPVLGICRGAQLINVAFGGSLYQDIATQHHGSQPHVDPIAYDAHAHEIEFVQGSALERMYGARTARVNSIHHQAVNRLGSGLAVEARSVPDGVVEAIRWNGGGYVAGVQWHPEFHDGGGLLDNAPLLDEFLERALQSRGG